MSTVEPGAASTNLVERVKSLLLQPGATWDVIDKEPATIGGLYRSYVMILAAIPAICTFIGFLIFGLGGMFGISIRLSPVWLFAQMIVSYALSLAMVYVMALIIEALAPNFGGTKDRMQAFKVAAYAPTASWVAGVFGLMPALAILAIVGGLYSLYLLYRGLPKLMKVPEDKATTYFVVVLVVAIVVALVIGVITSTVTTLGGGAMRASSPLAGASINVPGKGSVDLGKLEEASKRMEAASKQIESGDAAPATDPEILKAYLPPTVGGFTRTEVSASSGGVGGVQGSGAQGAYAKGDASIRLEVTDMGAAGALAGMAGAFNVNSSKETSTGYEKIGKVDGRMTQESYDRESKHGEYSVMVADRFMVQANGDGATMDELKAAVNAVGLSRLEGLAKAS
jgi:Yip1-like protein